MRFTREQLFEALEISPVIPAVKSRMPLDRCLAADNTVVFLLSGSINEIVDTIKLFKAAGKIVFVHVDLIDGLSAKDAAVDFFALHSEADGIISTKPQLVRHAGEVGLLAIQRFFVLDSLSVDNVRKICSTSCADMIEILPGLMPKIIRQICADFTLDGARSFPLVAGGLISDKEDVLAALNAGAIAVSSTNADVWAM